MGTKTTPRVAPPLADVPSLRGRSPLPPTSEQRTLILEQLGRILDSSVFKSSKRYPALLKFVVEETLEGREETIKERTLGVEVFGRSPDYDTNSDHVVRTAAGEVRKRLAQYYMEPGRENELRVELPSGSYVPQFRPAPEYTQISPAVPGLASTRTERPWWKKTQPILIVSVAANLLLCLFLLWQSALGVALRGETTLDKFWDPVFRTQNAVLLCVGIRNAPNGPANNVAVPSSANQGTPDLTSQLQDPLWRRVAMADVLTLARVSAYVGKRGAPYRILNPVSTSFEDLQAGPTVLIGAGNNSWTNQIADKLRFSFLFDATHPIAIKDKRNPSQTWTSTSTSEPHKDYAIVSRLVEPRVEQIIVIVGGLGPHGTETAGQFVTNPLQMNKLNAYAPAGWENKNVQIVLSTEVVKGSSGPPKIEAAWFW